ncbi:MAG TPA: NHL repeat-containing protein, partial [Leptospiraceae bacterium]|nr:NHL repeat-containing protein [Leptospiraceae bacterium]
MKRLFYCKGFLFLFLLNCLQADKSAFDFSTPAGGIFFISGILSSVNSSGSGSSVSSPTITYSSGTSYNFFAGSAISPISPTLTGTVIGCSVSPSLPAGLSISSGCVISGTASSWSASTIYTITATASGGTASVSITLRVQSSTAVRVYGQLGSFTSSTANNGGSPSANNLTNAFGYTAADSGGNLYVADYQNNRVLYYPSGSTTATRVYGQAGSFTSSASGTSATALFYPSGIAVDSAGNLYAAEASNHRVLYFPSGSTTATRVYGQNGSYTCTAGAQNNNGSCVSGTPSANNLNNPYGIALDSADNLYVADSGNHRVLYYPSGSTTATRVYGQLGSFTSNTANNGGSPSANNLTNPSGAAVDSSGNLYITDRGNSRVLYYPSGSTTATRVYGQL